MKYLFVCLSLLLPSVALGQLVGDRQNGLASYYSAEYEGAETAYGEVYYSDQLVAAHKTYPYNSTVRVTNQDNGRSVTVRIIDKGPFIRGRVIEVSERAARDLGLLGSRTVPVELELLSTPTQRPVRVPAEEPPPAAVDVRPAPPQPRPNPVIGVEEPVEDEVEPQRKADPVPAPFTPPPATPVPPPPAATRPTSFTEGVYRIELAKARSGNHAVQVGSYANLSSALDKVTDLQARYFDDILIQKIGSGPMASYKVLLGPFRDAASARNYAADLKSRYGIAGFAVALAP